jgi:hypothetical protein
VPSDQVAAGEAPELTPAEDLDLPADVEPVGQVTQVETVPEQPGPEDEEPAPEEGEGEGKEDPEEFERDFDDIPEDMPPLLPDPTEPTVPTVAVTAAATRLPQTGADLVLLELVGGLLMGAGLALRLALRPV